MDINTIAAIIVFGVGGILALMVLIVVFGILARLIGWLFR